MANYGWSIPSKFILCFVLLCRLQMLAAAGTPFRGREAREGKGRSVQIPIMQ